MSDPRIPDPRPIDPNYPQATPSPYSDPAADPRLADRPMAAERGRGGLIAAGVIAVLLVIAVIAFNTGPNTDPGTTAVIPDQTETVPAPMANEPSSAPDTLAPAAPAPVAPAAPQTAPAPAEPAAPAPAPAQ